MRAECGRAEALVCDHLQLEMIAEVVSRIDDQQGRLDFLVNDIGGEADVSWRGEFWKTAFTVKV